MINVTLVGLPGDMATRNKNVIDSLPRINLADSCALTGEKHRGQTIDEKFISRYEEKTGIRLFKPHMHEIRLLQLRDDYVSLYGINAATAEGYGVNELFVKNKIPFISMTTGVSAEEEGRLVGLVKGSKVNAIIDKNMSSALVVFGAMLNYAAEKFPNALEGYTGFGMDEHQKTKTDPISGSLLKWQKAFEKMGVDFYSALGSRKGDYGHADHFMRVSSPTGDVKLNWMTEVLGRDTYANGAVRKGLPFLIEADKKGIKGKVYSMEDALSLNFSQE